MVVIDATMLMLLVRPEVGAPLDEATGLPVAHVQQRIAHFVEQQEKDKSRIGIPTPALSEVLVRAGAAAVPILEKIKEFSVFEILPFDELSAIEMALMTKAALDGGDKRGGSTEVWAKVKFDRQIIAIARVHQASAIYSDDGRLRNAAGVIGLAAFGIGDLELPPEKAQHELPFEKATEAFDEPTLEEIEEARNAEQPGAA
jgi:hypothetical protein